MSQYFVGFGMLVGIGMISYFSKDELEEKKKVKDEDIDLDKIVLGKHESRKMFELRRKQAFERKFKKYTDLLEKDESCGKIIEAISLIEDKKYK